VNGEHISQLNPNGTSGNQFSEAAWGLLPSDKAVVFLQNHDTQHDCAISYRHGATFRIANVWMLAQPYGYPSILSSYAFDCPTGNSMGPPSDASGWTTAVSCAPSLETATVGTWVCEHRDPYILNMVSFRRVVAGSDINHWWDDGANAIAFSRGTKGFVAINNGTSPVDTTIPTGMAAGTYLDLLTGSSIVIDATGVVHVTLSSKSAIAIDTATRQ
jgi:alpha-amylase